jgi:chromosome segregation protein
MLKSIEISGFKSFVDKTVLDFQKGITAVVGPNGSGKSNIVDAIRWVLGEQSSKNIRINNGAEVIFSGTPSRPASAFAYIALYFDNSQQVFPVAYEEVCLARKIYRDGNSEYFLNKKQVRLKDIVQLCAGAKLGVKGMNIINQGAADIFLRANPIERREMIEEMVGLKEYRIKKEEAGRKIRETKDNLLRVQTLIAEMEPNLRSLRRQVSRWQSRAVKETELKESEKKFFLAKLHELDSLAASTTKTANAQTLRSEQESLENEISTLTSFVRRLDSRDPETKTKQENLLRSAREWREQKTEIVRRLGNIEGQLEAFRRTRQGKTVISLELIRPQIELIIAKLEQAENKKEIALIKGLVQEAVASLRVVLKERGSGEADAVPDKELAAARDQDLQELERVNQSLRDCEKNIQQFQAGTSKNTEELRRAYEKLEACRIKLRKVEAGLEEIRFAEEKKKIKDEDLKLRIEEAGWIYDELKQIYQASLDQSEMSLPEDRARDLEIKIIRLRRELGAIGEIDSGIVTEYQEINGRHEFLANQEKDLSLALEDWQTLDQSLEEKISAGFTTALGKIDREFNRYFSLIFDGGTASLRLSKPELFADVLENQEQDQSEPGSGSSRPQELGVDFSVHLPRKKIKSLEMLSGGEKALAAIALLFAIIAYAQPPFLVFDEIDATLDEHNSGKIAVLLRDLARRVQFILITHNRSVMEAAQILYGITMDDGVSRVFSLRFAEAQEIAKQDVHNDPQFAAGNP